MDVLVIGGGFVGTVTATVLAERRHQVTLVEADPEKRAALAAGRPLFEEPGLPDALSAQLEAGRLHVAPQAAAADVGIICVGTPRRSDGSADLSQVEAAAKEVAQHVDILAVKSTVPPGTLRRVVAPAVGGAAVHLASMPEFLAEGTALDDAREPRRVVIGSDSRHAIQALAQLQEDVPVVETTPETAETIKYACNAMLAARVGVVNELANLCEAVGADVDVVMDAVGRDDRIGPRFLVAGLGFGGSCFPKDVAALCHASRLADRPLLIMEQVLLANGRQPLRVVDMLEAELGPLAGTRIALLGLAFKPGTSDTRESRALVVHQALLAKGARVVAHDPVARVDGIEQADTVREALADADACIVATAWPEYRSLHWQTMLHTMRRPVVIDAWRLLDPGAMAGARYRAIGRGNDHESRDPSSRDGNEVPSLH